MNNKVLIIDDEISPKKKLGKKINQLLNEAGFDAVFAQTWMDQEFGAKAKNILQSDPDIRMVLLDVIFPKQRLEGGAIFEEIKNGNICSLPKLVASSIIGKKSIDKLYKFLTNNSTGNVSKQLTLF